MSDLTPAEVEALKHAMDNAPTGGRTDAMVVWLAARDFYEEDKARVEIAHGQCCVDLAGVRAERDEAVRDCVDANRREQEIEREWEKDETERDALKEVMEWYRDELGGRRAKHVLEKIDQ